MAPDFQAIIFDFDYTLADSSRGIIASVNYALNELGLPLADDEAIRQTIGLSLPETLVKLAGEEHSARCDEFVGLFIERADQVMVGLTILLDAVPMTIERLKRGNAPLGIVSTKFRYRIEAVLRRENLLEEFAVIVGGEDVPEHKPSPQGLYTAIERLGCASTHCLYVGDSVTDAETAKRAGVPFVAVLSGVTSREDFADYEVYKILEDVSQLSNLIEGCS
jgi:phosphoglycolate phosphatase